MAPFSVAKAKSFSVAKAKSMMTGNAEQPMTGNAEQTMTGNADQEDIRAATLATLEQQIGEWEREVDVEAFEVTMPPEAVTTPNVNPPPTPVVFSWTPPTPPSVPIARVPPAGAYASKASASSSSFGIRE